MFKGIKKAVIKHRVIDALESRDFGFLIGGIRSTGSKFATYYGKVVNAMIQSLSKIGDADKEKVGELVADAFDPAVKVVEGVQELIKLAEKNEKFFSEVWEKVVTELNGWEDEIETEAKEILSDGKSMFETAKKIQDDYLK